MADTLEDIIFQVGRNMGNVMRGVMKGGDTTYISDSTYILQPDNFWTNHYMRVDDSVGEERLVSDHTGSTLTFSVALASTIPASGMGYTLLPLQRSEIVAAIKQAIYMAGDSWVVMKDDSSGIFTTDQEYALPSDMISLWDVYGGDGVYWHPLTSWEVLGAPGAYKLLFKRLPEIRIPQLSTDVPLIKMRLVYAGLPTIMSEDSDTIGVGDTYERGLIMYLIEYASYVLHLQAMQRNLTGEAARGHMSAAEMHRKNAESIREQRQRIPVVRRAKTRAYPRHI